MEPLWMARRIDSGISTASCDVTRANPCTKSFYLLPSPSLTITMAVPSVSNPCRPARPTICSRSPHGRSVQPPTRYTSVDLTSTRRAGRFTPTARVLVAKSTRSLFCANSCSLNVRS